MELDFGRVEHQELLRRAEAEEELRLKKARSGIDMLRQVKQMEAEEDLLEQQIEEKRLVSRSQASIAALLSMADAESKEKLIEFERIRVQEGCARADAGRGRQGTNPEAAQALARNSRRRA